MSAPTVKRIGEILIDKNLLLPESLEKALARQKQNGRRLGQILVEMSFVTNDDMMDAVSEQMGIPHIWLRKGLIDPIVVGLLPREKAEHHSVIPMFLLEEKTLTLAMADSSSVFAVDDVERITGYKVRPVQCRESDIQNAIGEYYQSSGVMGIDDFLDSLDETDVEVVENNAYHEDLSMVAEEAEGARIINLVNMILLDAIKAGASDIHIEPQLRHTHVRYRLDGVLQEVMAPKAELHAPIISRIKIMGKMDIAERRLPQDGRIQIMAEGKEVDVRVSTMPTVLGENSVMRLLDKGRLTLDINNVGFYPDTLVDMKKMLRRPNGIMLVTGPTGSGKTTTLYCGLNYLNSVERKTVTIEDPVEYKLPRITQIQVNQEQGLSFSRVLRSVLRQDPDVIMVGEIRDKDTAEVAIQAALTGHMVLSTLHTNDSAGAIARLIDMGIEPFLLTSTLIGVVAQRLIRKVCPSCRTDYFPPEELLERVGWAGSNKKFVTGRGCTECYDSGLRGREGILELLSMSDDLASLILRDQSIQAINDFCVQSGMRTLKDEAFRLVEQQETSLEEVMRVVFVKDAQNQPFEMSEA
jgi:type IV pilus assembly protein PilB